MRRLVVASAILATLLTWPLAQVAAAPTQPPAPNAPATAPTDSERATSALAFLLAAQRADGSLDGSIGETADFVVGAAAVGFDPATLRGCSGTATSALDYLATASDAAATDAAKTGKAALAVVAAGGDPAAFRGRDLVARLSALYNSGTGAYGDGSTFSESFAILAVRGDGRDVAAAALTELKALQDPDGSWSYGKVPVAAGQGDTNSTAIALMALDAAGDHSLDATGLAYLRSQQLADGGFPYQNSNAFGPPASDADSDAIVLQALVAAGQDPAGSSWLQGSNSVLTQLRASQAAGGGFAYPGMAASAFTTSQVPAALMLVPYAAAVHPTTGLAVPTTACQAPAASATATATVTRTPSATATAPDPTPGPSSPGPLALLIALLALEGVVAAGWAFTAKPWRR
ncbi:MAG TPA: prenyltransferase/squalene oxidase repeat-containing protein [Candidatus Limnocylindrales bacterium]